MDGTSCRHTITRGIFAEALPFEAEVSHAGHEQDEPATAPPFHTEDSMRSRSRVSSPSGFLPSDPNPIAFFILPFLLILPGCGGNGTDIDDSLWDDLNRHKRIPADVVKGTPENDQHPPVLHSQEFEPPVPVPGISTAGAEDSPFIPADRDELYFFFVSDVRLDPSLQIRDPVNGIWRSRLEGGVWQEPELVLLQKRGELALNGCPFVAGNEMYFCTFRAGSASAQWFRAERSGGGWANWTRVQFPSALEVGELHFHGDTLYFGSTRPGGLGGKDIWRVVRSGTQWTGLENVEAVNSAENEDQPYISPDGQELWFTRRHQGTPGVFRSRRGVGSWQEPELIVSRFAGEPTLDRHGNLYFVHHYYRNGVMIEADIYLARRK